MQDRVSMLRKTRHAKGLSIKQAARLSGIDRGYLSRVERGLQNAGLKTLKRLSILYDEPIAKLAAMCDEAVSGNKHDEGSSQAKAG